MVSAVAMRFSMAAYYRRLAVPTCGRLVVDSTAIVFVAAIDGDVSCEKCSKLGSPRSLLWEPTVWVAATQLAHAASAHPARSLLKQTVAVLGKAKGR